MTSETVQAAQRLLAEREALGLRKYGMTVDRTDLAAADWLQHAIEEASDLLLYLIRLRETMQPASAAAPEIESQPVITPEMVQEAIAHAPFDIGRGLKFFCWMADRLNHAIANPGDVCHCCGVTAGGNPVGDSMPVPAAPEDAERNIRAKEDAERAAYLERWMSLPVWVNFLTQDADGQCKGWERKPELYNGTWARISCAGMWGFVDSLRGVLGSVRCESRPTTEASNGDLA